MATTTQVSDTLKLKITFGIAVPVPPNIYANYIAVDDISDWSSILAGGETIKTLYHIQTQVNTTVYKSAGYDTNDFSNPEYPTNDPLAQKQLPTAASGDPVEGVYKINVKIQYFNGTTNTVIEKTVSSQPLCLDDAPTVSLSPSYSCKDATFTSQDATSYGNSKYTLQSVVRSHIVYPPDISGQSSTTVDSPTNTVGSLWTNVNYEIKLTSTVTYKKDDNYFIFVVSGTKDHDVVCDDALCTLYCLLKKVRDEYYSWLGKNPTQERLWKERRDSGTHEYFMAVQARLCGKDESAHVTKFYTVTNLDPDCDCGCGDGSSGSPTEPAPVVAAVSGTPGDDGEDGLTPQLRVSGNVIQWKYTTEDASQWRNLIDISAFVGADGEDGSAVLYHEIFSSAVFGSSTDGTLSSTLTDLKAIPVPKEYLDNNDDTVELSCSLLSMGANAQYEIVFKRAASGGSTAILATGMMIYGGNTQCKFFRINLKRESNDTIKASIEEHFGTTVTSFYENNSMIFSSAQPGVFGQTGALGSFDFSEDHQIIIRGRTLTTGNEIKVGMAYLKANNAI